MKNLSVDLSIIKTKNNLEDFYLQTENTFIQNMLKEISPKKEKRSQKESSNNSSNILQDLSLEKKTSKKIGFLKMEQKNKFFRTYNWKVQ